MANGADVAYSEGSSSKVQIRSHASRVAARLLFLFVLGRSARPPSLLKVALRRADKLLPALSISRALLPRQGSLDEDASEAASQGGQPLAKARLVSSENG